MVGLLLASIVGLGIKSDPSFFPVAVWLQSPSNAARYKAAGFNLYVGLWQGPTEEQLAELKRADMPVMCEQNAVGLAHLHDPTIFGWMHGDEPDNAQEVKDSATGKMGYGPCIPPEKIVAEYQAFRAKDPTRPIMLNLGQGVANDEWIGRGNGSSLKDYETYVKGGDIVSFDVYPIAGLPKPDPENYLWYVPKGVDRLTKWMNGNGSVWNCIECTRIDGDRKATPAQVRSEVWMSLVHGSHGLIYFVHQFKPTFDEHALLDDPQMLKAVTEINHQIQVLAPVLNSPSIQGVASVSSASESVPIDIMVKRDKTAISIFAVAMRNGITTGRFRVKGLPKGSRVDVVGENRDIVADNGGFADGFQPYEAHIYRVSH